MRETHVQRNYKDTMFHMLFKEKENLLSLYNAVNKTSYTDVRELEITTLENAVYMNYKNDISFVFDFELMLYEHQSTVNPNLPLRDLIYVTKVLHNITKKLPFQEAVREAVDYCIRNGILADFLSKNRAEAIAVSIFEYDEEKYLKKERELAYKSGIEKGRQAGKTEGEILKLIKLICKKVKKGQSPEKIAEDLEEKIEAILPIYQLAIESAPEYDSEKIYKNFSD